MERLKDTAADGSAGDAGGALLALLREGRVVSESLLRWAAQESRLSGRPLHELLVERAPGAERDIWRTLAAFLRVDFDDLSGRTAKPELAQRIPSHYAYAHAVAPLTLDDGVLVVAASRLTTLARLDELAALTGAFVEAVLAPPAAVSRFIQALYGLGAEAVADLAGVDADAEPPVRVIGAEAHALDESLDSDQQASITRFVNRVLIEAVKDGASDIHIEPYERQLRVRFRIDGELQEVPVPPNIKQLEAAIISRVKVLGDMDIAEKRLSQDGQMRLLVASRPIDVRVSVLPTIYGESVVLRILDRQTQFRNIDEVGLAPTMRQAYCDMLELAQGLILVTGPTGSGKTTTLYGSLNYVNRPRRKIITIEDPVEYRLEGISQVQVKESIGLSFSTLLRNIVRHDPDVIMVGEVRDAETAHIALNSAMTGHLVFSTLHTNDAPSAVTRLLNMGAPAYLIAAALKVVLAQRLVRVLCPHCRHPAAQVTAEIRREWPELADGSVTLYHGHGCDQCRYTGYRGRTGIFELLLLDEPMHELIFAGASAAALREAAVHAGMVPLRQAGAQLVREGITTIEEVYRVTRDVGRGSAGGPA